MSGPWEKYAGGSVAKPGPYRTALSETDEKSFQSWVKQNHIPNDDSPTADYDMRGYYRAMRAGDPSAQQASNKHFPDTWKTPYHKTFSNESIYATQDAPRWQDNRLVDKNGKVVADESTPQNVTEQAQGPWEKYGAATQTAPSTQPDTNTETFPDHATISAAPSPDNPLVKGVKGVGRFLKNTFVDLPGTLINAYQDPTAAGELVHNVAYGQGEEQRKQLAEESPEDTLLRRLTYIPLAGTGVVDLKTRARTDPHGVAGELLAGALLPKILPKFADAAAEGAGRVSQTAGKIKSGLTVSDDLKQAAAQVPDAATKFTAGRTAGAIHEGASEELMQRTGDALDKVASKFGVDTTSESTLSTKAELAGRAAKTAGQKLYTHLDKAAEEIAGAPGGRFQRYAETVRNLERESLDPALTANQQEVLTERLNNARTEFEAFKQEMVKRGLDEKVIRQADKLWSQGAALDELSRGFLGAENTAGRIKPTARPLDTPIKKMTAPASGRGHILKQATGDQADTIASSVKQAQERIAADKAAKAAAQNSVKATKESADVAQKRIDVIRGRQKAIAKGAAAALGVGAVAKSMGTISDVLSGR